MLDSSAVEVSDVSGVVGMPCARACISSSWREWNSDEIGGWVGYDGSENSQTRISIYRNDMAVHDICAFSTMTCGTLLEKIGNNPIK